MNIQQQILDYLKSLPDAKQADMVTLHNRILQLMPDAKLWYFDGRDENGKVVANPQIGYGCYTITYANTTIKEFYRIGISANTGGISIYLMCFDDKKYLSETYGQTIGKAKCTGYCIKFRTLNDINVTVLEAAICDAATNY